MKMLIIVSIFWRKIGNKVSNNRRLTSHQLNGSMRHQLKIIAERIVSLLVAHGSREVFQDLGN